MAWVLRALDLIVAANFGSNGPGEEGEERRRKGAGGVPPRRRSAGEDRTRSSRVGFEWGLGREAPTMYA